MLEGQRRARNGRRSDHNDAGVPKRKHKTNRNRALPLLHQLPRHVVNRRYVICIDGVPQPKAIC